MKTRSPGLGIWNKDDLEKLSQKSFPKTPCTPSKYVLRLENLEDELNSLIVKGLDGSIDMENTNKRREKLVKKMKVPKSSKYYPEGYGLFYNKQGLFVYGQVPE